jgi:hypothetical protein
VREWIYPVNQQKHLGAYRRSAVKAWLCGCGGCQSRAIGGVKFLHTARGCRVKIPVVAPLRYKIGSIFRARSDIVFRPKVPAPRRGTKQELRREGGSPWVMR